MCVIKHSTYLGVLAVFLLASPGPADDPPKGQRAEPPGSSKPAPRISGELGDTNLFPNALTGGEPFDLVIRGNRSRYGRFDADGNFIPEPFHESMPPHGPGGGPISFRFTNNIGGPSARGEHRSGRLILGTMVKGVFVPEIGSKVLDIKKDFDVTKPERLVWNLWETVPAFWTEEREKQFPNGLPKDPAPPAAGVPAGWELVSFPDKPVRWDIRVIGKIAEFGHLDEQGEFIPEYSLPIVSRDGLLGQIRTGPQLNSTRRYYTLPFDGAWGMTEKDKEEVYEYRSGRLIKGTLHKTGNFVPEIGSKVLDFKDYDPSLAKGNRIYNLPGVLRKAK